MKGKWQTDAVRHNNNTSHDGAVMRTITRVYPRQPQQCNSFCRFRESISVWLSFLHPRHHFYHQLNHHKEPFIITKASTSKKLYSSMFSSLLVLQNPSCIVIPAEAMNNSDSSWGCDEYKLANSEVECVKKASAPHQTIPVTFPALGETVLHPNTH